MWWGLWINGVLSQVERFHEDYEPTIVDFPTGYYSSDNDYDLRPVLVLPFPEYLLTL